MKKVFTVIVALLMLLSALTGCGAQEGSDPSTTEIVTNAPTTEAPATVPTTEPVVETTEPVVETTEQTTAAVPPETEAETVPEVTVSTQELVTDAQSDLETAYPGRCYHIPRVNLPGDLALKVNERMYDKLYGIIEQGDMGLGVAELCYSWGQKDSLVSIVVKVSYDTGDLVDYLIYNVSTQTGKEVHVSELYDAFGLTEDEFYREVTTTLEGFWEDYSKNFGDSDFMDSLRSSTFADSNIRQSRVFIGQNGELGFVASIYSPAGAMTYDYIFTLGNPDRLSITCVATH